MFISYWNSRKKKKKERRGAPSKRMGEPSIEKGQSFSQGVVAFDGSFNGDFVCRYLLARVTEWICPMEMVVVSFSGNLRAQPAHLRENVAGAHGLFLGRHFLSTMSGDRAHNMMSGTKMIIMPTTSTCWIKSMDFLLDSGFFSYYI